MLRTAVTVMALVAATQAHAFISENDHRVNPLPQAGTFEVVGEAGSGPREYLCAAADYARHMLNAPANARVAVLRPAGTSQTMQGRRGVGFSMNAANGRSPGQGGNFSLSVREPGFNISVAMGLSFCKRPEPPIWQP